MVGSKRSWRKVSHPQLAKLGAKPVPVAAVGETCTIVLPWPPSVNAYWRSIPGDESQVRVLVSKKGKEFASAVATACMLQRAKRFGSARVRYVAVVHPPSRRVLDIGNLTKAIDDSLSKALVWEDDRQIDDFRYIRGEIRKGGQVVITIEAIG